MIETRECDATYVLGHSDEEQQRLIAQSRLFGCYTDRLFRDAGLGPGMRVLDVGCGVGDVALLAADLVGQNGAVVGVDRDPAALATARSRAAGLGLQNITFVQGDFRELTFAEPFDAVVGRFILMYVGDPVAAVRQAASYVRPGGILAFQELDFYSANRSMAQPPCELLDNFLDWVLGTFRKGGAEMNMGLRLHSTFVRAGLPKPRVRMDTLLVDGTDMAPFTYLAAILRSTLPMIERFGLGTAEEIQVDTFAQRLRDQVVANDGVLTFPPMVGAWVRTATSSDDNS
jgi:SAM-dependent methyltransferase